MSSLPRRVLRVSLAVFVLFLVAAAGKAADRPSHVEIIGGPGSYELRVNGRPLYVRSVSFSLNEARADPRESLTRPRLRFHFRRIREMGANTLRRYGDTEDTSAILSAARSSGLMVMMGYWLDHDVDYLKDLRRLDLYRQRIREWVLRYKSHPAVLMWVLGNETWGLLKREFDELEELTPRRVAYYKFVDELSRMIKSIDPHHPVMSVDEHVPDAMSVHLGLETSLAMFREHVPSVDVFGVNSYFAQDISGLRTLIQQSRINRAYLVAEFGPPGYWLPHRVIDDLGEPVEPTDFQKAAAYAANWQHDIEANRGWNLGGNAFLWKDKQEGSFTWFGLTDTKDRLKPAYWALREAWTGRKPPRNRPLVVGFAINKRWIKPEETFVVRTRLLPTLDPTRYTYTYLIAPVTMAYVDTQFSTDAPEIPLHAPGISGVYRVYVYVTTKDNTMVSTGSATFAVYSGKNR